MIKCIDCGHPIDPDDTASCPFHRPQARPLCRDCLAENHRDCEDATYKRGSLKS